MNKLFRFYNKNRHMVWLVILVVVAVISLIQILNNFAYKKNIENKSINEITKTTTLNKNYSVITRKETDEDIEKIVEKFIDLCNSNNIEDAYEILSNDCKEILYPTLDDFENKYYNKIFETKKTYIIQSWITNIETYIYKIDFVQDMLATGSASKTSITDYYTVVKEDNEYKLNINKFIGTKTIDVTETSGDIAINVKSKKVYMDYEVYDIEVKNNTQSTILLDDLQKTNNIYVEDSNMEKYFWDSYEFLEDEVMVRRGAQQEFSIKFNKEYNPNNNIKKIVFTNIISKKETVNISVVI